MKKPKVVDCLNNNMENDLDIGEISDILSSSVNEITEILKAIGTPNRLQILIFLLEKPRTFSFLLNRLDIKRTTLVHHLDNLLETNMIEREERGRYKISENGVQFLVSISKAYQNNLLQQQKDRQNLMDEHTKWPKFYKEPQIKNENIINPMALYQGGWNSYVSAISGVLASLGVSYDYIYVSGRTGYCFILNTAKVIKSSVMKDSVSENTWQEIYQGTESFGWKLNKWEKKRKYPGTWTLKDEDIDLALETFNQVIKIIDKYNTPVVLYGIHSTGFGIVNGYQKDSYIVSTYYRMEGREEIPIKFDQLKLLDKFSILHFSKHLVEIDPELEDKKSINRAIKFAKGIETEKSGWITGIQAYDNWINVLESGESQTCIEGNSILGQYQYDAKYIASEYLDRLARKYKGRPQSDFLKKASQRLWKR